jgi:hypothetical protein
VLNLHQHQRLPLFNQLCPTERRMNSILPSPRFAIVFTNHKSEAETVLQKHPIPSLATFSADLEDSGSRGHPCPALACPAPPLSFLPVFRACPCTEDKSRFLFTSACRAKCIGELPRRESGPGRSAADCPLHPAWESDHTAAARLLIITLSLSCSRPVPNPS